MARWLYLLLVVAVAALVAAATISRPWDASGRQSSAHIIQPTPGSQGVFHASIDADPNNGTGPCDPVDTSATALVGFSYRVAVCIESVPEEPAFVSLEINYDGATSSCTDIPCPTGDCLDDNPDANTGTTTFGPANLGVGWDCNPFDISEPTCHSFGDTARIYCVNIVGPYTVPVGDVAFPLAILNLNAIAAGTNNLALAWSVALQDPSAGYIGSCNPDEGAGIPCNGAEIVSIASTPAITPMPTPSVTLPMSGSGPLGPSNMDGRFHGER